MPARPASRATERTGEALPADLRALVAAADTFFVASAHPERGVDASHRGGNPGFVKVLDGGALEIPDYAGNSMFNTLGNFAVDARAGLLFIDFEKAASLQLIGDVEILWDSAERRRWRFRTRRWRHLSLPAMRRWEYLDASPFNPPI